MLGLSFGLGNLVSNHRREQPAIIDKPSAGVLLGPPAAALTGAFLGCLATLYLGAFGIDPAIASALATTLLCGQVLVIRTTVRLPVEFFAAVYGGSFGGMTPVLWLSDSAPGTMPVLALFVALSAVCGVVFCIIAAIDMCSTRKLALGYGGRSGATATLACFLFVQLASWLGVDDRLFRTTWINARDLDPATTALACAACMTGLFSTMSVLRHRGVAAASPADRIFVAAAIALIGLTALQLKGSGDAHILDAFYAGCFLGMSTPERLNGWLQPVLGAVVLTAILIPVRAFLPGVGGSLGFAAFVTVALLVAVRRMNSRATPAQVRGRPSRPNLVWRVASAVAHPVAAVLALGCFVWLDQRAPQERGFDTVAVRQVAADAPPALVQSAPVQPKPSTVDVATALGTPADGVDLALSMDLPPDAIVTPHAATEGGEQPLAGSESVNTVMRSGGEHVGATDATADTPHADLLQASHAADSKSAPLASTDTATRATSASPVPPTADALPERSSIDDPMEEAREFQEFLQWRAAHGRGIAQAAPQLAKRRSTRASQLFGLLTPAGLSQLPRPARPRPSLSADAGAPPPSHPLHARRPADHPTPSQPAP